MVTGTEPPPERRRAAIAMSTGQLVDWLLFLVLGSVAGAIIYFVVTSLHL